MKKLRLQLHTHLSHDWLTAGTSKYNNVFNDLVKDETFDKTLIRIHFGLGTEYIISDNISAYLSYNYGRSIKEHYRDSENEESYAFTTKSLSIGLLFNISKTRY